MTTPTGQLQLPPGADPALEHARPDAERIVYNAVRPLGQIITWSLGATDGPLRGWHSTVEVQTDVRGHNRAAAYARADAARRVVCALPWAALPGVVCSMVDVLDGPLWAPDDLGPRYVLRFAVQVRPA